MVFSPGDDIVKSSETCTGLYLLSRGEAENVATVESVCLYIFLFIIIYLFFKNAS